MAKVDNNIFVRGLKGSLGDQFVIRRGRNGETIIANKPSFPDDHQFNESQLACQDAFKKAIRYAKTVKHDELYVKKAEGTKMTPFNAAVKDWFNKPEVLEIDVSEWDGAPGDKIHVHAEDDTLVTLVYVTISDGNGVVLEEGAAQRAEAEDLWWTYTADTQVPSGSTPRVVATAYDQPGNETELAWQN